MFSSKKRIINIHVKIIYYKLNEEEFLKYIDIDSVREENNKFLNEYMILEFYFFQQNGNIF